MTDTPRTLDELLTLFADNTARAISPQDLRDFVVSVANPVAGGGVGGATLGTDEVALSKASSTVTLDGSTTSIFVPLQIRKDPNDWVVADGYTSPLYGIDVPDNSSVLLPPGVYHISWDVNLSGDPGSGKIFAFFATWADEAVGDVVYDDPGFFFGPAFGANDSTPGGLGLWSQYVVGHGVFRQTQEMFDAGVRLGFQAYQSKGSALNLFFSDVFIVKVL